jgi:hypothetical protein
MFGQFSRKFSCSLTERRTTKREYFACLVTERWKVISNNCQKRLLLLFLIRSLVERSALSLGSPKELKTLGELGAWLVGLIIKKISTGCNSPPSPSYTCSMTGQLACLFIFRLWGPLPVFGFGLIYEGAVGQPR